MKYVVIESFRDLKDHHYPYSVGDTFPRKGGKATKTRCRELSTSENRRGIPLIMEVNEDDNE